MPLVIQTPPASRALTTVERVTQEFPEIAEDFAELLIVEATSLIEGYCSRQYGFGFATFDERLPGPGGTLLQLEAAPLFDVITLTYRGAAITDYEIIDRAKGWLYRERGWEISEQSWGSVLNTGTPGPQRYDYAVRYRAGWQLPGDSPPESDDVVPVPLGVEAMPGAIERACLELVRAIREAPVPAIASERIGDYAVTYRDGDQESVLPPRVRTLLMPYRKVF